MMVYVSLPGGFAKIAYTIIGLDNGLSPVRHLKMPSAKFQPSCLSLNGLSVCVCVCVCCVCDGERGWEWQAALSSKEYNNLNHTSLIKKITYDFDFENFINKWLAGSSGDVLGEEG